MPTYTEWTDRVLGWGHWRWWQTVPGDAGPLEQLHIPHGGVEVRWRCGEPPMIVGPAREAGCETLEPGDEVVGYRFASGRWPDLPYCSVPELADRVLPLDDVLQSTVAARPDEPADVRALALFRALDPVLRERPTRSRALALVDSVCSGDITVRTLARDIGWSERQARRRIRMMAGLTVSELRQLGRFQRFVALVQQDVARGRCRSIVELALAAGYADQSHLHRACRAFTGHTPKRYLARTHRHCIGHCHDQRVALAVRSSTSCERVVADN